MRIQGSFRLYIMQVYFIPFNFQRIQEKGIRSSHLISMTIVRKGLILKAVPPLGRCYKPDFLSLCWDTLV